MNEQISDEERFGCIEKEIYEIKNRLDGLEKITTGKPREGYMGVIEIEPGTKTEIEGIGIDALSQKNWYAYAIDALNTLSNIADKEECCIDHRGFCRTHNFLEKPCPIGHARELLKEFSRDLSTMANIKKELLRSGWTEAKLKEYNL